MINRERFSRLALAAAVVATTTIGCDKGIARAVETTPRATASDTIPNPASLKETGTVLKKPIAATSRKAKAPEATATSLTTKPTETIVFPTVTSTTEVEPTVKTLSPTKVPERQINRGRLPINPQNYSLSCESASAENVMVWYNSTKADSPVEIPPGFENFEDYFIAGVELADNPIDGYCGKINGWLSTSCDGSTGAGYGVYPHPIIRCFRELGVPAEMFVFKDNNTASSDLKKKLVDSFNNNQTLLLWGRGKNSPAVEFRTHPQTGEEYPMALGEHCIAGQVVSIDNESNPIIEISDPLPYESGSRKTWKFETLLWWMGHMGWLMALRIG